jgi:hypothetical protein
MKTPLWIIDHARNCRHSSLAPSSPNRVAAEIKGKSDLHAQPQYTCNLTDKRFTDPNHQQAGELGQLCTLYGMGSCAIRECFPDGLDH